MQAIALSRQKLAAGVPDSQRAIYICWLNHLIADLHQPLHSTSLFSRISLPRGDRGGNFIPVQDDSTLHVYWDRLLGGRPRFSTIRNQATSIITEHRALRDAAQGELSPKAWGTGRAAAFAASSCTATTF